MLLTSSAYTYAEIAAIVLTVLAAGTCKFVAIYSIRRGLWKRGLLCATGFLGIIILVCAAMNGDLDLSGNRVWIVRDQGGQFVKEEFRLLGSYTVALTTGAPLELKALPCKYIENGETHHNSVPACQVVNDAGRAFEAMWRFYNGKGAPSVVAPGMVQTLPRDGGGELVIQDVGADLKAATP